MNDGTGKKTQMVIGTGGIGDCRTRNDRRGAQVDFKRETSHDRFTETWGRILKPREPSWRMGRWGAVGQDITIFERADREQRNAEPADGRCRGGFE